jgi:hypothetical protein
MKTCLTIAMGLLMGFSLLTSAHAQEEDPVFPNEVETHIGKLTFDLGVPTEETSEKLYYEMNYHRAVQCYLWGLPMVGQTQWRQTYLDQYNIKPNQLVFATKFNERAKILTANESTPYMFGGANVKDKAAIVQIPAGPMIGLVIDWWERGIADVGVFGPNAGKGDIVVFSGPETPTDEIPYIEGAEYVKSKTNNIWYLFRINAPVEERDALASKILTGSAGEDLRSQIIPGENKFGRNYHPRGITYWEYLHKAIQEESVAERDRFFMYFLKDLGIEKGKPFNPTDQQKKILLDAMLVGEAMAKNMVFRERLPGVLRADGWRLILGRVEGSEPGDAMEHTQRAKYFDRFDPFPLHLRSLLYIKEDLLPERRTGHGLRRHVPRFERPRAVRRPVLRDQRGAESTRGNLLGNHGL